MPSNRKKRIRARQAKTHESWQTAARHVDTPLPDVPPLKPLFLDETPLPSDWDDIQALWADMATFAEAHQEHVFLSADDPGYFEGSRIRVPRMGWTAFKPRSGEGPEDEQARYWTITLGAFRASIQPEHPFRQGMSTALGRMSLLSRIIQPTAMLVPVAIPVEAGQPLEFTARDYVESAVRTARGGTPSYAPDLGGVIQVETWREDGFRWGDEGETRIQVDDLFSVESTLVDRWGLVAHAVQRIQTRALDAGNPVEMRDLHMVQLTIPFRRHPAGRWLGTT